MRTEPRLPLADVATRGRRAPDRAVTPALGHGAWLARVDAWRDRFSSLPAGDIALHFEDAAEFAGALFGAWHAGRTPWLAPDALPATRGQLAGRVVAFAGDGGGDLRCAPAHDADAATSGDAAPLRETLDARAHRLVLFTSGSTGEPVAISKSLCQLDAEIDALEARFGEGLGEARVLGTVSHQHIYGLLFRVLWPLSAGRAFAPRRVAYPEELAVPGTGPVVLVASPAHLKRLPETPDWRDFAASLRAVFSSGGPLPADAAQAVRRLWSRSPIEVFGSTETGGVAWRQRTESAEGWTPLPGVEWRLVDDALQVRSRHLAGDGWFATADRAQADDAGGFTLLGRADRIVKLEERRISLDAIERGLLASPLLQDARVVVLPGRRVRLGAVVVASPDGEAALARDGRAFVSAALRASLADRIDAIAVPRRWRFVPALPADAQGKTGVRALRALFHPSMPAPHWERRDSTSASARLRAAPDVAGFGGHFPDMPVLPGVVLLDWAVRLAAEAFGPCGVFLRMESLKFQQLVRPGADLQATLDWQPGVLSFRFTSEAGVHASGRMLFAAEAAA